MIKFSLGVFIFSIVGSPAFVANASVQPPWTFRVERYRANIHPNLEKRSIKASVQIDLSMQYRIYPKRIKAVVENELVLDVASTVIDSVSFEGIPLNVEIKDNQLHIPLHALLPLPLVKPSARTSEVQTKLRTIKIEYHGEPKQGLFFQQEDQQIYTLFDTPHWLPCQASPDHRASIDLKITVPQNFHVVANGSLVKSEIHENGMVSKSWQQNDKIPCYLYGFAAGRFREVTEQDHGRFFRYLASEKFSDSELQTIFKETAGIARFYERKSGKKLPSKFYTQVLVNATAAQELEGFAVLSEKFGRRVLKDHSQVWLIAHELSHQWWGNRVTNHSWTEMWLNEGIASYLNAAYLGERFGKNRYQSQIDAARISYYTLRADGHDKPLKFASWSAPSAADRSLVYDKGTYVMHLLRMEIGDNAFWKGLKDYTQQHWGSSVSTADLQYAMERASGKNLRKFFDQWVLLESTND